MTKGKLIIFSAPSGAGKTTIVKHLLKQNAGLRFSISATSRVPRHSETHGKDYYFLSPEEFQQKIKNNDFLEWEEVYAGTHYGTLKEEVERIRKQGKHVVFDVDVVGGINIKNYYKNEALAVFVKPPCIEELRNRLIKRSTDSDEVIERRIAKAEYELTFAPKFDIVLLSQELPVTLANAEKIVTDFING